MVGVTIFNILKLEHFFKTFTSFSIADFFSLMAVDDVGKPLALRDSWHALDRRRTTGGGQEEN